MIRPLPGEPLVTQATNNPRIGLIPFTDGSTLWIRAKSAIGQLHPTQTNLMFDDRHWINQPWISPIIGTGAEDFNAELIKYSSHLPEAVTDVIQPIINDHDSSLVTTSDPIDWVHNFVSCLIKDKIGPNCQPPRTEPSEAVVIKTTTASLILATAALTRSLHRLALEECRPIRWRTSMSLRVSADSGPVSEIFDDFVTPAIIALRMAYDAVEQAQLSILPRRPILSIIDTTCRAIDPNTGVSRSIEINYSLVEVMCDICWLLLSTDICGQPTAGWRELLLTAMLLEQPHTTHALRCPTWLPEFNIDSRLRGLMNRFTEIETTSETAKAAANLLWAQADAARESIELAYRSRKPTTELPHPVGFSMSFDMSIATALWSNGAPGSRFSLIVPVIHRAGEWASHGVLAWIEWVITIPSGSQRSPAIPNSPTTARILTWGSLPRPGQPTVVFANGCPSLDLLELDSCDIDGRDYLEPNGEFIHSLVIDEYTAIRRNSASQRWATQTQVSDEAIANLDLPPWLFSSPDRGAQRFWTIVGVSADDPAVCRGLISVLQRASTLTDSLPVGESETLLMERTTHGLSINRELEQNTVHLLQEFGITTTSGECFDIIPDITECANKYGELAERSRRIS